MTYQRSLLAIDPGRSFAQDPKPTIGYCVFGHDKCWAKGEMTFAQLADAFEVKDHTLIFNGFTVDEIVIEDFVNDPRSARGGQRNGTSECIGGVEMLALMTGVPFTRQPNTILPVAKKHAGYIDKLKHLPHPDSAYLHGYYYLVNKGVLQPKGLAATLE